MPIHVRAKPKRRVSTKVHSQTRRAQLKSAETRSQTREPRRMPLPSRSHGASRPSKRRPRPSWRAFAALHPQWCKSLQFSFQWSLESCYLTFCAALGWLGDSPSPRQISSPLDAWRQPPPQTGPSARLNSTTDSASWKFLSSRNFTLCCLFFFLLQGDRKEEQENKHLLPIPLGWLASALQILVATYTGQTSTPPSNSRDRTFLL